jgi:hypothetical protein
LYVRSACSPVCALEAVQNTVEAFSRNIVFENFTINCWVISIPVQIIQV